MIDASRVVSIVRRQDYDQFNIFIDHFKNDRIDVFLTRINYHIGELQYIKGTISINEDCTTGQFDTHIKRVKSLAWSENICNTDHQLAQIIINALYTCIKKIED